MAKKQIKKIEPGILVTVEGKVDVKGKGLSDEYYEDTAKVLSLSPDGNTVEIAIEKTQYVKGQHTVKTVLASTWVGNLTYWSAAPKYDKGDIVSLAPVKILDYEIYGDNDIRYVVSIGEDDHVELCESDIAQVLHKE